MARKQVTFNPDIDDITRPEFTVFSSYDFNDKNVISSPYPIWYFDHIKEELKNSITTLENSIKLGFVSESRVPEIKEHLKQLHTRYKDMEDAQRKFTGKTVDFVSKVLSTLSEKISNSMPSRYEMTKGLARADQESRLDTTPCIPLNEYELIWAKACNIPIIEGKVNRVGACTMWQIGRKILGEDPNTEILRKENKGD